MKILGPDRINNIYNQSDHPHGLFIDKDQTTCVADYRQDRVVIQGKDSNHRLNQLYRPMVVIDQRKTRGLLVFEEGNHRVYRWFYLEELEVIIDKIHCTGLSMNDDDYLYVSDESRDEVQRYRFEEKQVKCVAGGNGYRHGDHQLNQPRYIYVSDEKQSSCHEMD